MTEASDNKMFVAEAEPKAEGPAGQFEKAYQQELEHANASEMAINQKSRDVLSQRVEAKSLRAIGVRKVVYGLGLTTLNAVGTLVGWELGARAGQFVGNKLYRDRLLDVWNARRIGMTAGGFVGDQGGKAAAGLLYDHLIRRIDKNARGLDRKDWIWGQFVTNPVFIGGIRDIWNGHKALKALGKG